MLSVGYGFRGFDAFLTGSSDAALQAIHLHGEPVSFTRQPCNFSPAFSE